MIARLSLIFILLISNSVFGMEDYTAIPMHELGTTDHSYQITSLRSWKDFAKDHESIDEHVVSPKTIAEFQQNHEIKTDLPLVQEAIQSWASMKYVEGYKTEILRMHAFLRGYQEDIRPHAELADLKGTFIKKAYVQLDQINKNITSTQQNIIVMRPWGIGLCVMAAVFFVGWILEMVLIPRPSRY